MSPLAFYVLVFLTSAGFAAKAGWERKPPMVAAVLFVVLAMIIVIRTHKRFEERALA